jgi:hypothetical protein
MFLNPGLYKRESPGLDRLATAIDAERSPGRPFLLVSNGDFVPPYEYPNVRRPKSVTWVLDSERLQDPTLWRLMDAMEIDVMVPGLTELRHSSQWLLQMQQACPSMHVVSINVADTTGKRIFPHYVVLKRSGVRFGVLGICGGYKQQIEQIEMAEGKRRDSMRIPHEAPRDSTSAKLHTMFVRALNSVGPGLRIDPPSKKELARAVAELRNQCDVVVALLGIPQQAADSLLRDVSGIDVAVINYPLEAGAKRIGKCTVISRNYGTEEFTKVTLHGAHAARGSDVVSVPVSTNVGRTEIADRIRTWMNLVEIERDLSVMWNKVFRPSEPDEFFGRLDSVATRSDGRMDVFVIQPEGDKGQLTWRGLLKQSQRPLSADLTHPGTIQTLQETRGGSIRDLPVGSDEETQAMQLLRFLAVSQESGAERESLLANLEERERRDSPWMEWGRMLDSLHRVLERQRGALVSGDPPYWRRRAVVYASVALNADGRVFDVSIVENNDWPVAPDSLKQLDIARSPSEGSRILIGMAKDRREKQFEAGLEALRARWGKQGRPVNELVPDDAGTWKGTRLPKEARKALDSKNLSSLVSVWKKADPEFSWDDFISTPSDTVQSPEHLSRDPESSVLRKVATKHGGSLFVGWSTVEHQRFENGTWAYLEVPTVWLSEDNKPYLLRFQGALTPQINAPDVREALEATLTGH